MKKCYIFCHKWSKWELKNITSYRYNYREYGVREEYPSLIMFRICEKCGLFQFKRVKL